VFRFTRDYCNYFDKADNAFISAYRKHHRDGTFDIRLEYISCPDLQDRILILSDPMLATGSSLVKTIQFLKEEGPPAHIPHCNSDCLAQWALST
jgi:uracil phosphoribosyltransferase